MIFKMNFDNNNVEVSSESQTSNISSRYEPYFAKKITLNGSTSSNDWSYIKQVEVALKASQEK